MNKRNVLFVLLLFFVNISFVYADCTEKEKKTFREISSNVTIDNSFDYATKTYTLVINLVDDSKYDINLNNRNDSIIDCSVKDSVYTCTGFKSGDYDFTIDGITDTCDITLKRINVRLPKYNKYYEQDICDGYHYLAVCSEFFDRDITEDELINILSSYDKKDDDDLEQKDVKKDSFLDDVVNFLISYYIEIIVVIVFIVLLILTIIMIVRSSKKRRRLE